MTVDRTQAYHDDLLDPDERRAFERDLEQSPELRAELDAVRAVDDDVRRAFTAPSDAQLTALIERAVTLAPPAAHTAPRRPLRTALAIAAALVMMITGTWLLAAQLSGRNGVRTPYDVGPQRTMYAAYRDAAGDDWTADWECPPDVFAQVFDDRLGAPLALDSSGNDDMMALGVSYAHVISTRTTCVLIETASGHALVIVDRLERDTGPPPSDPGSALHVHRRELGPLVLYEISPDPRPHALDAFSIPEADAE